MGILEEKEFPTKPGVYQMINSQGQVIYVGKARNLKKRVSSYFQKRQLDPKTSVMLSQVVDIQITLTSSANEALLLEDNLVKQFKPRYNILLRDDKSYPYLFLSSEENFPRLDFHRGAKRKAGHYYGPYPSAGAVRDNLALIQKLFKLRQCNDNFFSHRSRPCLQYQIQRCTAPCVNYVTVADYGQQVEHARLFLAGKNEQIIADLADKMEKAADERSYERAAYFRDQIATLRKIQEQQSMVSDDGHIDILGISASMNEIAIAVLFVRHGRLIGHKTFFPAIPAEHSVNRFLTKSYASGNPMLGMKGGNRDSPPCEPPSREVRAFKIREALSAFIPQYYLNPMHNEEPIERIITTHRLPDKEWIQNALEESLQRKITITDRKISQFKQWQNMADNNAEFALRQHLVQKNKIAAQLEELQKALGLPNPISRMECFDISHTGGESAIASCVVFNDQGPLNSDYRYFNIRDITPGDDYAALRQSLSRHYTRLKSEEKPLPDLLIIDGGQGQLAEALLVLEELQVSGLNVMAVSKGPTRKPGLEKLWLAGHKKPLQLPENHLALHVIQMIRDEAHRFAITAHRKKRAKISVASPLESIEGIGPKRRRDLLRHFGGLQGLQEASVTEIMRVSGISEALAQRIFDHFH